MAIKVTSTKNEDSKVKVVVYSRAGMGKTTLCGTAPTPLILSAEAGLLSLREQDIDVIEIKGIKDIYDAYEFLTESDDAKKYETICLDSITEIAEVMLSAHKKGEKDGRQAYMKLADDMATLIRGFRDLPDYHMYFTAKQTRTEDSDTGVTSYRPMMPGNTLKEGLSYFFDEVGCIRIGQLDDGEEYRYLQFQPSINYDAKDRSGSLGKIEKPDLAHIFNKCLTHRTDAEQE